MPSFSGTTPPTAPGPACSGAPGDIGGRSSIATAVTPATPLWLMIVMVALVMASALVWYSIVSLFMSSAPVVRSFAGARHRIERFAGVCFVAIGGRILADSRNPLTP